MQVFIFLGIYANFHQVALYLTSAKFLRLYYQAEYYYKDKIR